MLPLWNSEWRRVAFSEVRSGHDLCFFTVSFKLINKGKKKISDEIYKVEYLCLHCGPQSSQVIKTKNKEKREV